jgi:hypothetical protein
MDFAKLLYVDGMAAVTLITPTVLVAFWLLDRARPAMGQRRAKVAHGFSPHPAE